MTGMITGMGFGQKSEERIADIFRVLYIQRKANWMVAIPIEPRNSSGRTYFVSYKRFALDEVEAEISAIDGLLCQVNITPSPFLLMRDDEVLKSVKSKERRSKTPLLKIRDERWQMIKPLVEADKAALLFDKTIFSNLLRQRACELEENKEKQTLVYNRIAESLYRYWAGGSHINALIPHLLKCGGPSKSKTRGDKKLGRPNAPTAAGMCGQSGYQLADRDIEIIKHCWKHFLIRGTTVGQACRRMWSEFYADPMIDSGGKQKIEWLSVDKRPTLSQFGYWGEKESPISARRKLSKRGQYEYRERPLPGLANQGIWAVGQLGAIDSTPTDVELVSATNRLDRIGIANRVQLVDGLHRYIPGFYQGLIPPSEATVKLAVYHSMMDKTQWLKNLGLLDECPPADWLPIQFQSLIADNTDARSEGAYESLIDSGVLLNIQHISTYRSDLNSMIETSHHSIHRLGDHKLLGTNHGRRSERGETRAEVAACHTLIESIRDTARTIHTYNTMEMPDTVLSLAMRGDGVRPTRLDMTRWEIEHGNIATNLMGLEQARSLLLPVHDGIFNESGVRLLRPNEGKRTIFIRRLTYISKDNRVLRLMEQARSNGSIDAQFRVDPFDIRNIWYFHTESGELIELTLKKRDADLESEFSLFDVIELERKEVIDRFRIRDNKDRAVGNLEQGLDESNRNAQAEYNSALESYGKPLSRREIKNGKQDNRKSELNKSLYGIPIVLTEEDMESAAEEGAAAEKIVEKRLDDEINKPSTKLKNNIFDKALSIEVGDESSE